MADEGDKEHEDYYPQAFRQWSDAITAKAVTSSAELNRFAARYRAAMLFDGIQLKSGASKEWQQGFSALLKVFLAYTAAESLRRGLGEKPPIVISLIDRPLANSLRSNNELPVLLQKETHKKLSVHLLSFINGDSDDVGRVAAAIRHLVAHGTITVGGADVGTIKRSGCLLECKRVV